jgi:tetratricopeptide (TPR) repeat protein
MVKVLRSMLGRAMSRVVDARCERGAWRSALGWMDLAVRHGLLAADERLDARTLALQGLGDVDGAVACARAYLAQTGEQALLHRANMAIDVLNFAGHYAEALAVTEDWSQATWAELSRGGPPIHVVLRVNQAESLYNLGRWSDALDHLVDLDAVARRNAFTATILAMQRAWIFAHHGQGDAALDAADSARPATFPPPWRSEPHYSRCAALLACGRIAEADFEARSGLEVARRASSERNGWFLLARVTAAGGALERACEQFQRGAEHAYRRQGGGALLAWGDILAELGRTTRARAAWALAVERDPQSESARVGRERLSLAAR